MTHHPTHIYNILIVEDDPAIRKMLQLIFSGRKEYQIEAVANLRAAQRAINHHHFDLMLLDIRLPDGSGLDLCRELTNSTPHRAIKVIILTGRSDLDTRVKSFDVGAADYVSKPFYPQELLKRVERLLDSAEQIDGFDNANATFRFNETIVKLTPTQFLVAHFIASQPGVISIEQLKGMISARSGKSIGDDAVRIMIMRLRHKFKKAIGMELIKTRHRLGYYWGLRS